MGWSLSGLLAVTIAHQLSQISSHTSYSIAGLLLIDTQYHRTWRTNPPMRAVDFTHLLLHVNNCLDDCIDTCEIT